MVYITLQIKLWYNDGMISDTWLAIGAGATFLLALAAFWAIWDNRRFQRREYKHRLLNEIIEWAVDVAKCGIERESSARLLGQIYHIETFRSEEVGELELGFKAMSVRNKHIKTLSSTLKQPALKKAVDDLIADLGVLIGQLEKLRKATQAESGSVLELDQVAKCKSQLDKSSDKVIEEAAKIKTKEIG